MTILKNIKENKGRVTLASVLITSLMLASVGLYVFVSQANAAAVTSSRDTLTVPTPTSNSNHTVQFVTPTGAADNSETITITFPAGFSLTGVIEDDIDIAEDTSAPIGDCASFVAEKTTAAAASITEWGVAISGQVLTLTHPTASAENIAAGACIQIQIGTNATSFGTGVNQINNPSKAAAVGTADTPSISIAGTFSDTGDILVAIIEGVTVSVTIDESLSFTLANETAANCPATVPGTDQSGDAGHTATAITFGTLSAGNAFNHSCHLATVSTNAGTGYTTTVEKTQLLTSGSNTIADGTCNGACSASVSAVWSTTTNNGFGYCLQDVTGNPALTTDASDDAGTGAVDWETVDQCNDATPQFKTYPTSATTEPVMKSYTGASGDQIRMGTVLNYSATQAPGAYTTTLLFIATPTF